MFDTVMSTHGTVDVLVNNAGLVSPMLHFFDADEAWWRRIIDVNLTGHFLCCHRAARIMAKNGGGSIINMSSGGATRPIAASRPMTPARAGSRHSLGRWRSISGHTTSASAPSCGSIDPAGLDADARAYRGVNIPAGRIGDPHDMTQDPPSFSPVTTPPMSPATSSRSTACSPSSGRPRSTSCIPTPSRRSTTSDPMTGSRTGGQIVAGALVAHGVSHVFGVPGEATSPFSMRSATPTSSSSMSSRGGAAYMAERGGASQATGSAW